MAAEGEEPVYDVLNTSVEYLCKLGSNLRVRSENLKNKKIFKNRVRNSHAIQKAAQKVLLLCKLSKKSLQNVEGTVDRILTAVQQAQSSSGKKNWSGDSKTLQRIHSKNYEYFEYESRKLRIARKVALKHFLSVKVLARSMPYVILKKYPVYYDCKLFRERMKKDGSQRLLLEAKDEKSDNEKESDCDKKEKNEDNTVEITEPPKKINKAKRSKKKVISSSDHDSDSKIQKSTTCGDFSPKSESTKKGENSEQQKSAHGKLKRKRGSIMEESSSESESKPKNSMSDVKKETLDNTINDNSQDEKHKSKKRKKMVIIDDSSEESQNSKIESRAISSVTEKCNEIIGESGKDSQKEGRESKNEESNKSDSDEGDEASEDKVKSADSTKPLIKCVSISKLLKPCVLNKVVERSIDKERNKMKSPKLGPKAQKSKKSLSLDGKEIEEKATEEYWKEKRLEVKAFRAKKFDVVVYKLPKLTTTFLDKYNLCRITQFGSIICEKNDELIDKEKLSSETVNSLDKRKVNECSISTVKNALLNDSDSDDVTPKKSNEADKIKKTLLQESDSENNETTPKKGVDDKHKENCKKIPTKNVDEISEKTKKALLSSSDSENNKNEMSNMKANNEKSPVNSRPGSPLNNGNTEKHKKSDTGNEKHEEVNTMNTDAVKSALLNSSDDNDPKTPADKTRRGSEGKTPRSKRKHIMESMHAKKMLLTYSSSSETEDEQLRSVLKEIKDSLLKGISSDEEKKVKKKTKRNSHRRKLVMSSDDDDDDESNKQKAEEEKDPEKSPVRPSTERKSSEENKSESESKTQDCSDGASDKQSNSSRSKIGCPKTNSAGSGSSRNSDSPDTDKDINGLTNLKTLNKIRRRRPSTSTDSRECRRNLRRAKMPKAPVIDTKDMLPAESSSDSGSGVESDAGEDLPTVTVPPLNGGLADLSKEDLLVESDSSSSKNDSDTQTKEESDENVKSKRRKAANAISSDSEVGSSRRKNAAVKLSDFEDSEEESSEPAKKNKRKKAKDDSDASAGSGSDSGKKKRRRIKQVDSEGSGSDTENEGRNKHGRKNIRKVMGKNQLEEATKKAARQEKERIARIAERQKLYNNLEFDESGKPDEVVLEKVILDFDPETKEPLIQVDRGLVKKLKPHQANGIKFMWDACFESVKRIKKDKGSGCILAHCMGLGKTLQVVSLTHTLLIHGSLTGVNRVLVVCPLSTVLNWVNEFKMWLKHAETEYEVDVYELSRFKQNSERAFQLQQWYEHGGVCVLGYEMFRNLSADNVKKFKKKMLRHFQESLVDPGPDLVVCDEGHLLKNEKTSLSQSMNRVKTLRRIVLTGTPLQNNLKEYYCMVQFVKPNLLGKYNEYLNRFVNPITNGQYTDSTEHDIRVMKRRSHVLHKMLDGAVQRRDYGVLAPFLPPKHEYVLFITLTELQIKLYQYYLDNYSRRPLAGKSSGFLFPDFQSLQRIWTHPLVLKYNSERYEIMQQKKRDKEEEDSEGSLVDFIDDDSTPDESSTEESSDDSSELSDDSRKKSKKKKSPKKAKAREGGRPRRGTRANPVELEEEDKNEVTEVKNENPTEWWMKLVTEDELEDMRYSAKLILLFDILRQCETIGDKLLVFSQSLYSLDLIEHFLGKVDEATQEGRIDEKLGGHVGSWSPGVDYFRLDGSTSCENRSIWCKNFNREDNPRARLFLISTRAGGLGINLVAANRVVIFDVSWNPSHDVQSIFRVYRFGQKKPCYIYRFLAMGTMEEKIYERQVTKQAISKRVIDEQQIDRHYAENDLAELYKFEAHPPSPRPIPPLPKDRLFAEMLREHEAQIYKYHEHDSLLENKEEETLSEEERKAAWEDFENEKNRPPPAPAPMAWPGMVPGILQQQQLAYAALAAMLRKDMPNINDQQIRDMLPLIYNANPGMFGGYDYGLMQKMGEIYKYAQPGMMNPGMMNPLMAAAGAGAGGAMGGSSSLQYEPPWQRQQQQQQQMRLQQILQQQQNMGAKYYAGGLGSRDPVAMALQQQRAREIMVGERTRPRGRPPLQPRLQPGDVVNLDSD